MRRTAPSQSRLSRGWERGLHPLLNSRGSVTSRLSHVAARSRRLLNWRLSDQEERNGTMSETPIQKKMQGAYLPGDSTTVLKEVAVAEPGHGEVLLRMKASTICGSDIRCIYHEHLGKDPEGYEGAT